MSDLPMPQDATEGYDAVLSYADLCTSGSAAAARLAAEAFARGTREKRGTGTGTGTGTGARTTAGPGHRPVRLLPRIPLLLTAVRTTAAAWEAAGQGHELDPDLRLWLNSARAARYTGPPARRPLALRALRDMPAPDAELLWLAEVEALPLPVVARRLGLDPATITAELAQVREIFRDRCRRARTEGPADETCRRYARLLDAVTRPPAGGTGRGAGTGSPQSVPAAPVAHGGVPEDLSRHLATCPDCAEAAGCLRVHDGGISAALAGGVVGWGGLAYLERRRRAAEARLGAGRPPAADDDGGTPGRARAVRGGLFVAAALVSLVALTASLRPFGGPAEDTAASTRPTPSPTATAPA
uniref:cellulose-binding protein n=1 Tax=Streptomyces sp. CRN 30 TaxID=3075613 RepID=UPI002A80DA1C